MLWKVYISVTESSHSGLRQAAAVVSLLFDKLKTALPNYLLTLKRMQDVSPLSTVQEMQFQYVHLNNY